MMHRVALLVLVAGVLAFPVVAGEAGKGGPKAEKKDEGRRGPPMGMIGKFILDHAKELALTDEQKAKIEAFLKEHKPEGRPEGRPEGKKPDGEKAEGKHGKGPFADILTEEQRAKLHELLKAARPEKKEREADAKP